MRRLPLALVLATAGVLATPAAAADSTVKISNFSFSPSSVSVHVGEKVTWNWAGPDTNHSVTSDSGQSDQFDSAPGNSSPSDGPPGETFSHTFSQVGTFTYHCKVHSFMHGKVNVAAAGAPLSDTAPPKTKLKFAAAALSSVAHSGKVKVKVTVNEAATERLTLRRAGHRVARKTVKFSGAGSKNVTLKLGRKARKALAGLSKAKLTLSAKGTDKSGNSKSVKKSVTLRKGRRSSAAPAPAPAPNY
jgi:plastocyanin